MQLKTTGDLRGFLADVLVGIRDGSIDANQANSISKVAAQINQSLSTEVQARINLKELGGEAGQMIIASDHVRDVPSMIESAPTETPKIITQDIPRADVIDPSKITPMPKHAEQANPVKPIIVTRNRADGDKIWCDQCETRVTTSQAIGCKSQHCKAKDAA
jgi:hypothetical protein